MNRLRGFERISYEQFKKDFEITDDVFGKDWYELIKKPCRATALSAGYDCYATTNIILQPGEEIKVGTAIKSYMLPDEVLFAYPRSGHGFKYYIRLANTVGVLDSDYYNNIDNEGHIWIKIRNEGNKTMVIKEGEAFCQLIFQKYLLADGDDFEGKKRDGGLGSTDK